MGRKKKRFYKDLPKGETVDTVNAPANKGPQLTARQRRQRESYLARRIKQEARPQLWARLAQVALQPEQSHTLQSTKDLLLPKKHHIKNTAKDLQNTDNINPDGGNETSGDDEQENSHDKLIQVTESRPLACLPKETLIPIDMLYTIKHFKKSSLNPLDDSSDGDDVISQDSDDQVSETLGEKVRGKNSDPTITNSCDEEANVVTNPSIKGELPPEPTSYVLVERPPEVEEERARLPVYAEEQHIMETIRRHPVTIICGETGSGKTTQIPQFLYEAGFGKADQLNNINVTNKENTKPMTGNAIPSPNPGLIGITQPRRVAAISMAQRVAWELGQPSHVAYQIRYDRSTVTREARIKFMTDGILLRELQEDFLLERYSVIILDEAHERNLNTDILIGMLSRVVRLRQEMAWRKEGRPLRLVIMSATLNINEFLQPTLFNPLPPLIRIEARQYPVTIHMARHTEDDYVGAAYRMIKKVHANLPPGGILVFLTGQQEILRLATKLKRNQEKLNERVNNYSNDQMSDREEKISSDDDDDDGGGGGVVSEADSLILNESSSECNDKEELHFETGETTSFLAHDPREPLHVLPLYSMLGPERQQRVFQPPPPGHRLCVLATNVAETSLTIPGIKYVVDSGRVKTRHFDPQTGAYRYQIEWCSQASVTQRAGRAGRLGPGHCYRLYSAAVYEQQLPSFTVPEIHRCSMEGVVLQLKAMGIDRPSQFPFPTAPSLEALHAALLSLAQLRAIINTSSNSTAPQQVMTIDMEQSYQITSLGRKMNYFPVAPVWARLLVMVMETRPTMAPLALAFVSVMSVGDPFTSYENNEERNEEEINDSTASTPSLRHPKLKLAGKPNQGDLVVWLNAFLGYRYIVESRDQRSSILYCQEHQLMPKKLEEVKQQYQQLSRILGRHYPTHLPLAKLPYQTRGNELEVIRQMIAQSLIERGAERVIGVIRNGGRLVKHPAYRLLKGIETRSEPANEKIVFLHPSSVMYRCPPRTLVYGELVGGGEGELQFIKLVTPIEPKWL